MVVLSLIKIARDKIYSYKYKMSALIRQSHATTDQALWMSVEGDTASGPLNAPEFDLVLKNGTAVNSRITGTGTAGDGIMYLQGNEIRFSQWLQGGTNTKLVITPAANNADILTVEGTIQSTVSQTSNLQLGNQISGTASIAIGADNVVINSTAVTATSKIFFSFFGVPSIGPGDGPSQGNLIVNPALIVPGTSFRVDLTSSTGVSVAASNVAVTFNWMIIN